jgi:hypothetical protein
MASTLYWAERVIPTQKENIFSHPAGSSPTCVKIAVRISLQSSGIRIKIRSIMNEMNHKFSSKIANLQDILQPEMNTMKKRWIIKAILRCHPIYSCFKYDFVCFVLRKFETVHSAGAIAAPIGMPFPAPQSTKLLP